MISLDEGVNLVVHGDNMDALSGCPDNAFQVIYIDPPFNTRRVQRRTTLKVERSESGDRIGFGGHRYLTTRVAEIGYDDAYDDYLAFIGPRLAQARRVLAPTGTLFVHLDWRESHYCKVLLDTVFGRECFLNELIWAYDYGGRSKDRWPAKHDTILVYVKNPAQHYFDQDAIERIPYLAPRLVGPEKAARGKLPTDVWWQTIVATSAKEKTGYPNQKPEAILRRILEPTTRPGDWVLDFFAGSGTTGAVAAAMGRRFVLIDSSPAAIAVTRSRLDRQGATYASRDVRPAAE